MAKQEQDWHSRKLWTILDILGYKVPVYRATHPDPTLCGEYNRKTVDIHLQEDHRGDLFAELDAFWHESLHAIEHIVLAPDDRMAERQVNAIALGQLNLLLNNPEVLEFLIKQLHELQKPKDKSNAG